LIPDGLDITIPVPVPDFVIVKEYNALNVAITLLFELIVTVTVELEPVASPDHPLNIEDEYGTAVNVILMSDAN
jgi:hypothetical protein